MCVYFDKEYELSSGWIRLGRRETEASGGRRSRHVSCIFFVPHLDNTRVPRYLNVHLFGAPPLRTSLDWGQCPSSMQSSMCEPHLVWFGHSSSHSPCLSFWTVTAFGSTASLLPSCTPLSLIHLAATPTNVPVFLFNPRGLPHTTRICLAHYGSLSISSSVTDKHT